MPAPRYRRTLSFAATLYVLRVLPLAELARDQGVPVERLRRELKGIVPGQTHTLWTWLDAVPGRRAAWDAMIAAHEAEHERLLAELEAMIEGDGLGDLAELLDA
ncbi:hypothetical protein [Falsiroseomonas sp. E2-1-a4]|uniref:hypothetical protein n=1 Tax=Falsiroseomonas sp. E2-1-a4 TaxID=3239299 RepID=UPI003F3EDEEB